jgi:hypothetical protein
MIIEVQYFQGLRRIAVEESETVSWKGEAIE